MKFELNGEPHETRDDPDNPDDRDRAGALTIRALLVELELERHRVAVAINSCVVPKSRFDSVEIHAGDRVEMIQAVGGG